MVAVSGEFAVWDIGWYVAGFAESSIGRPDQTERSPGIVQLPAGAALRLIRPTNSHRGIVSHEQLFYRDDLI